MQRHDILVIGASAGGIEALRQLIPALSGDLAAAVFIVVHVPPYGTSLLPNILSRFGKLKAHHPEDDEEILPGCIYVAPPNKHLILKRGYIRLARGPRENNCRPAIDVLFRTAARAYGPRVIAVVLSGMLDDGTAGLIAVKERGGITVVQSPNDALFDGMPRSAIENDHVSHILRVSEMAPVLVGLVNEPVDMKGLKAMSEDMEMEADMAELEIGAMQNPDRPGAPSPYGCPECGGVLWELDEGKLVRFRCRTGHAYSINSLLASQSEQLEEALWNALRALEEKAALAMRMVNRAREQNQPLSATRFQEQGQQAQQRATIIRQVLLKGEGNGGGLSTSNGQLVEAQKLADTLGDNLNPSKQSTIAQVGDYLTSTTNHDFKVVALCASAGGLAALSEILSNLPADFPAAITVLQHLDRKHPSQLVNILSQRIALEVKEAKEGDRLRPGTVYIAPPDRHLLVNPDGTLSLTHTQLVHFVRPSADLLLESIAASFHQQAIAVILTGKGIDGAMGIRAIKQMGGIAIAQNEATAESFGMPQAAIDTESIDRIVPLNEIAATLMNLVTVKDEHGQFGSRSAI